MASTIPVNIELHPAIRPQLDDPRRGSRPGTPTSPVPNTGTPPRPERGAATRSGARCPRRRRRRAPGESPRRPRPAPTRRRTRAARGRAQDVVAARRPASLPPPAGRGPARPPRSRPRALVSIMTGPSERVESSRASAASGAADRRPPGRGAGCRTDSRTVSSGSSTSTVSEPTAIGIDHRAQTLDAPVRRRRRDRRVRRPGRAAIEPVGADRRLDDHLGPAERLHRDERAIQPARLGLEQADFDLMPAARSSAIPCPFTSGFGILHRDDDARDAAGDDARGARRRPPVVATRLERHVERAAPRALAGLVEREHFGVRPRRPWDAGPARR